MSDDQHDVIDDEFHADPDQEDIGTFVPEGEEIGDDLDVEDLEDLLKDVDPHDVPVLTEEDDDGSQ